MRQAFSSWSIFVCLMAAACDGPMPNPASPLAPTAAVPAVPTRINLVVSPAELPVGGGTAIVRIETVVGTSQVAPNARVTLTASGGELDAGEVTTDQTGHARVNWTGTSDATITARAGEVVGTSTVKIAVPQLPPPPSTPRPPAPTPEPTLTATIAATPTAPLTTTPVTFSATLRYSDASTPPAISTYAWDFGAAGTSTAAAPVVTFATPGTYPVSVTVTTANGKTVTASSSIGVERPTLTASITATPAAPTTADNVSLSVTLRHSDNSAPPAITGYVWTGVTSTTVAMPVQRFPEGATPVSVTVTTADGRTASAQATITAVRPTLGATLVVTSALPARVNVPVDFRVDVTNLDGDAIVAYEWDFEPGVTDDIATVVPVASRTYTASAFYAVSVTVTTDTGRTVTRTLNVTVTP
jgi:PKD repeat protein